MSTALVTFDNFRLFPTKQDGAGHVVVPSRSEVSAETGKWRVKLIFFVLQMTLRFIILSAPSSVTNFIHTAFEILRSHVQ